jgi:hypothetical protein
MATVDEWWQELAHLRRLPPGSTTVAKLYWRRELDVMRRGPVAMRPARVEMRRAKPLERLELNDGLQPSGTKVMPAGRSAVGRCYYVISPDRR